MSRIQTLIVAVLIAMFLAETLFSQGQTESSDPYFAPGSIKGLDLQPSEPAKPFGIAEPAPHILPFKEGRVMPKHTPQSTEPNGANSNANRSEFVAPPKPLKPILANKSADFRPPSVADAPQVARPSGSGSRPSGEGSAAKPNSGFTLPAPTADTGSGTRLGSGTTGSGTTGSGTRSELGSQTGSGTHDANNQTASSNEFGPGKVVAIVGSEPLFVGDMLFEANQLIEERAAGAPDDVKKQLQQQLIARLIPKFIDSKMLWIDALNSLPEGADIDAVLESADAEFDAKALPEIMGKMEVASVQEFDQKLRGLGSSLRQFRSNWSRDQLMRFSLSQKLQTDTDVSHSELLAYYRENRESYLRKARVRWEELAVRYSKTPDRAKARRMITELGNEVVYGAPFEAVAKRGSQGFTALEGGKHDWTGRGALVYTEVESALFAIPPGSLSEIIESRDGLHIVRVIEREEDSVTPFTEAQAEIRKKLENKKRAAAFEKHLTMLRKRIPFEVMIPNVELPPYLAEQTEASNGSDWK